MSQTHPVPPKAKGSKGRTTRKKGFSEPAKNEQERLLCLAQAQSKKAELQGVSICTQLNTNSTHALCDGFQGPAARGSRQETLRPTFGPVEARPALRRHAKFHRSGF